MGNPFDPWMATYPQGAVEGRPWWREHDGAWGGPRGGRYVGTIRGGVGPGYEEYHRSDGAYTIETHTGIAAEMARIDALHPLPVPPPMCGQVWADTLGCMSVIATGIPTASSYWVTWAREDGVKPQRHTTDPERWPSAELWPPRGAVLVSGPHAPWAPAGWKP